MPWLFLTLAAVFLWGFVNIFDKVLVTDYTRDPLLATVLANFVGLLLLAPLALIFGFSVPELDILLIFGLSLVLNLSGVLLYFKAIQGGEASRVITAFNTIPLFTLVLAVLLLGETLSAAKFVGIMLLVLGAVLVSLKKTQGVCVRKWILLVFLAASFFALDTIITKYLLSFIDFWSLIVLRSISISCIFIALLPLYYKKLKKVVTEKPKAVLLAFAGSAFYLPGRAFLLIALSISTASLVSAIISLQPFFVLLIAIACTRFFPQFLREEIDVGHVSIKLIAVILAVAGAALVSA